MKNLSISRRLIIVTVFIIIASISIVTILVNRNKQSDVEVVARSVLTKTYGVTLQDYNNLANAITQSAEDNAAILDYFHSRYGEQISENGYKAFINNRISSRAANTAYEENSDLKVTSIQLEPRDADVGSKRYAFTVEVENAKDSARTFTFGGSIVLVWENGKWKVDGVSPQ